MCSKTFSDLNDLNAHIDQVHPGASPPDQVLEPNKKQKTVAAQGYEAVVEQRAEFAYIVFYNGQSQEEQNRLMPDFKLLDSAEQAQWVAAYPGPLDDNKFDMYLTFPRWGVVLFWLILC